MHRLKSPIEMNRALLQLQTATMWSTTGTEVYEKTVSEKNHATQNNTYVLYTFLFGKS